MLIGPVLLGSINQLAGYYYMNLVMGKLDLLLCGYVVNEYTNYPDISAIITSISSLLAFMYIGKT